MKRVSLLFLLVTSTILSGVITIIDNGSVRKIYVNSSDNKKVSKSKGIIISFKNRDFDIKSFSLEYKLELKKRLSTGYYIFINKSASSDVDIIKKILKEQKDSIKTIRPNWGFGMIPN